MRTALAFLATLALALPAAPRAGDPTHPAPERLKKLTAVYVDGLFRAKLDSTQLSQYFIGTTEIRALEADVRAKGSFDQRAFDEGLVSHGFVAVKHLRPLLLGR